MVAPHASNRFIKCRANEQDRRGNSDAQSKRAGELCQPQREPVDLPRRPHTMRRPPARRRAMRRFCRHVKHHNQSLGVFWMNTSINTYNTLTQTKKTCKPQTVEEPEKKEINDASNLPTCRRPTWRWPSMNWQRTNIHTARHANRHVTALPLSANSRPDTRRLMMHLDGLTSRSYRSISWHSLFLNSQTTVRRLSGVDDDSDECNLQQTVCQLILSSQHSSCC